MIRYFWIGLIMLTIGCQKESAPITKQQMNVAYGNDEQQKMDIYLPSGSIAEHARVLVLIHGGGWAGGDKSDFSDAIPVIQQRLPNYAIINLNYRLVTASGNRFPTQENDIQAAIQFIFNNRTKWSLSDQFVLLGASAGAHLALLQSYKYNSPVKPGAVISFFGPTDLTALYNNNVTAALLLNFALGANPSQQPALYQQSSPVTFVNTSCPPTLLLQGGQDELVPPSQATSLQAALNTAGVPNQYVLYPTEGHGWSGANLLDSYERIAAFLQTYMP